MRMSMRLRAIILAPDNLKVCAPYAFLPSANRIGNLSAVAAASTHFTTSAFATPNPDMVGKNGSSAGKFPLRSQNFSTTHAFWCFAQ